MATEAATSPSEIPWAKCLLGCEITEEAEIHFLPCLHVLCSNSCLEKCTEEMENKESKQNCKKCLRKFSLAQIKRNVKIKDFLRNKIQLEDIVLKCGSCIMDDPVASYCPQCETNLCLPCTEFHPRLREKRGHQLDRNLEARRLIEFEQINNIRKQCESHEGTEANYFCFTCQSKMCSVCRPTHDNSHTTVAIADEIAAIRSRIGSIKDIQGIVNLGISKLEDKLVSLKDVEWKQFLSNLDKLMLRVLELLQERRATLLNIGRKQHMLKVKDIENKIKALKRAKLDSSCLFKVWNELSDKLDDLGMINISRTSLPYSETLGQVKRMLEDNFDEFVEKDQSVVLVDGKLSDLQKLLTQVGSIEMGNMPGNSIFGPRSSSLDASSADACMSTPTPTAEISSSKESNEFVAPNQEATRPRRIAVKSTGGRLNLNGRPSGMPHLNDHRFPIPSLDSRANGQPLPTPPVVSRATPPIRTYSSPNQKGMASAPANHHTESQVLNQKKRNSSGKGDQSQAPSSSSPSKLSLRQEKLLLRNRGKEENDSEKAGVATSRRENHSSEAEVTKKDLEPRPPTLDDFGFEVKMGELSECGSGTSETMDVDLEESRKKSGSRLSSSSIASSTATEVVSTPSPTEEKENGSETNIDDQMPTLSQSDVDPTEEKEDEDIPKITICQAVLSPSPSSTSTLSESSAHSAGRSGGLRKGKRERKQKIYQDCIDPETMRLPKKNDLFPEDPPKFSANGGKRRRFSGKHDTSKRVCLQNQDQTDSEDETIRGTSSDNYPSASETGSENGFGEESGSECISVVSRRLSLRRRRTQPTTPPVETTAGSSALKKTPTIHTADLPAFLDAPVDSIESMPPWCDYPIQGKCDPLKKTDDDDNDDYCGICLDGGEDIIVCCDFCPKVFHLKCHIPILHAVPEDNGEKWRCNYDKPKELVEQEMQNMPEEPDSEEKPLTDANPRQFALACKFMMEVYKIPEIPTMKWFFPELYFDEFKKAPYHLKYLREKLCLPVEKGEEPFSSVKEFLLAFKQMFLQAFAVYVKFSKHRKPATNCLRKFQQLVKDYYPQHQEVFENIKY